MTKNTETKIQLNYFHKIFLNKAATLPLENI